MEKDRAHRSFLFVTWDGGGNLPPALGIAQELVARGHSARFLGHRKQAARVEGAGLPFRQFGQTPDYDSEAAVDPADFMPFLFDHIIFEPLMAADLEAELDREPADAVVVDCMLTAPLTALDGWGVPAAVLVHTLHRFFDDWGFASMPGSTRLSALRSSLGLPQLDSLQDAWLAAGRVLVVSPSEFDPPRAQLPANTVHVGPVGERTGGGGGWDPAWGGDADHPLVLVSFSTTAMEQEGLLNRVVDALSSLPVRVLLTSGKGVDRGALRIAPNVVVREFVPHETVLPRVDLAICHAGHGTVMAALAHGVPLLCLPMGRDQPMIAARVEALDAGLSLDPGSSAERIRETAVAMLGEPRFRRGAEQMASVIARRDPAVAAAEELEAIARAGVGIRSS